MRDWGNPGSTRNLQLLLFLFFVAWRTRQVGARFDGEPRDGNDRSALRQRKVLRRQNRESTEITCQRETWLPASLSSEFTETPRPLLVQQGTISNTSGTATVHTNLHEKICLRNGRKCTCDPYRPPMFERYILGNPAQLSNIQRGDRFSGSLTNQSIVLYCGSQCVCCTCSFSHHVNPCAVRTTGLYEHNRIFLKMSVTHYELPCTFILHQNGYPVPIPIYIYKFFYDNFFPMTPGFNQRKPGL